VASACAGITLCFTPAVSVVSEIEFICTERTRGFSSASSASFSSVGSQSITPACWRLLKYSRTSGAGSSGRSHSLMRASARTRRSEALSSCGTEP
jgi:hypothetical protein